MSSNIQEDSEINIEVKKIKTKINKLNTSKRVNDQKKIRLSKFTSRLTGFSKCSECHEKQALFWQTTSHSKSFQTLRNENESKNLNCLPCHVTIEPKLFQLAQEDNTYLLSLGDTLNSVSCESCHGGGVSHANNPSNFKMGKFVENKICLNCHTIERDDNFSYSLKLDKIACPAD